MKSINHILIKSCIFKKQFLLFLISSFLIFNANSQQETQFKSTIDSLIINDTSLTSLAIQYYSFKEAGGDVLCYIKPFSKNVIYQFKYVTDKWRQFSIVYLPDSYLELSDFGDITSFDIINSDSLLIFQDKRISIFNTVKNILEYSYFMSDTNGYVLRDYSGIKWDQWSRKILLSILRNDDIKNRKYETDTEFGALLNTLNDSLEILPLKYLDVYKTSLRFSYNFSTGLCVNENCIIGFSGITSDLVVYDKRTKMVRNIQIKHKNQSDIELIDISKKHNPKYMLNHVVKNIWYRQLCYDKQLKLYYRIYMLPVNKFDYDKELSVTSKYEDKNYGIIVMNEDFKVLDDLILDNGYFDNWEATSLGLIVLKNWISKPKGFFVQSVNFQH